MMRAIKLERKIGPFPYAKETKVTIPEQAVMTHSTDASS